MCESNNMDGRMVQESKLEHYPNGHRYAWAGDVWFSTDNPTQPAVPPIHMHAQKPQETMTKSSLREREREKRDVP